MATESLTAVTPAAPAVDDHELRAAPRFGVGMPYTVDGHEGHTRDLSASGLSFDSKTSHPVGSIIDLTLRYGLDGHNFPLECQVEVVRVVQNGEGFTIAARWCKPLFNPDQ